MKQQCYLPAIWLTWIALPVIGLLAGLRRGWLAGTFVVAVGALAHMAYIRWFPRISRFVGYGSVADEPATVSPAGRTFPPVTLYTASVCPFCPLVRDRLKNLQRELSFELREIDVTLRPDLIREKGLRSVPVVETEGRFLTANATTRELMAFLRGGG